MKELRNCDLSQNSITYVCIFNIAVLFRDIYIYFMKIRKATILIPNIILYFNSLMFEWILANVLLMCNLDAFTISLTRVN